MKRLVVLLICGLLVTICNCAFSKPPLIDTPSKYSIEVTVSGIPKGQQTLFIPIKIDTMILDFDKVGLEGLTTQNILAVTSSSKDKVGTGVGLLKLDENGLPETLNLKVFLKPVSEGQTSVSLVKIADEPALLAKGVVFHDGVTANIKSGNEIETTEKIENGKKKLSLNQNRLTIDIQRNSKQEETIFIPILIGKDPASKKDAIDLDETFGHAIVAQGISVKSFSSSSLHEGGPGVEIVLTGDAEKDFSIDVDLVPRRVGIAKLSLALPQKGHIAVVNGPSVNINPATISVSNNPLVLSK